MRKGDVVLLPFPFTDLSGSKYRPAVILTTTKKDVIVAFITSQLNLRKDTDIKLQQTQQNGLKRNSILLLDKIATLSKKLITGRIGILTDSELILIDKNLVKIFQIKIF